MFFQSLTAVAAIPFASAQLNQLAQDAGKMYFGTATDNGELNNTQYVSILTNTSEFGQLTPSNGQKWFVIEPEFGVYNFSMGSVVADLAASNNQILRCHNLVWHSQLAPWVDTMTWSKENLTAALIDHVTQEATHWKGKCYAWDVLNEALNEDAYYNDYNIEHVSNKSNAARANIIKLLQDDGIRIDGVGLQSHFTVANAPSLDAQIENMQLFADMGLEIAITELDVRLNEPENSTNLANQSQVYENTVGACMQVDECIGITVWDFYDPFSWVPDTFPGQGSATLYFANFTKHPAYQGIVNALTNGTDSGSDNDNGDDCDDDGDSGDKKKKRDSHWWRL
ncbi:glycoside hydrolase [Mollisia scopiformis]|uniref:endo-1,4-beta-xylanase n=1 Tax=Mollisia scopiformis TaxID=149040 RepID=A0A194XAK2_MOLSC|nr:glycoside hydrolase [Mollisia scopiformis]KUJ17174.1 glycoside hydrolase [Mollisia scopiformis]